MQIIGHRGAAALAPENTENSFDSALSLGVRAWQVKDTAAMISAIQAGVEGMTVDFPHLLLKALGRE